MLRCPAEAFWGRGAAYALKGELAEAITDFTEAIRLNPKLAEVFYCRGLAYDKKGEKAKAEADFAQAEKLGYKAK